MTLSFQENPVRRHKAVVNSWECWSEFFLLVAACLWPFLTPTARIREETLESGSYFSNSRISDSIPFKLMPPWKFSADIVVSGSQYIGYRFLGTWHAITYIYILIFQGTSVISSDLVIVTAKVTNSVFLHTKQFKSSKQYVHSFRIVQISLTAHKIMHLIHRSVLFIPHDNFRTSLG